MRRPTTPSRPLDVRGGGSSNATIAVTVDGWADPDEARTCFPRNTSHLRLVDAA